MKTNGRRRWRKHCMRELVGRHARHHHETGAYAKPKQWFSPRSLVGMTQGARKRAAWHSWPTVDRSFFRIGERLRPCVGCPFCEEVGWTRDEEPMVPLWRLRFKNRYGVFNFEYPDDEDGDPSMPHCDGSGVLPAARSRR